MLIFYGRCCSSRYPSTKIPWEWISVVRGIHASGKSWLIIWVTVKCCLQNELIPWRNPCFWSCEKLKSFSLSTVIPQKYGPMTKVTVIISYYHFFWMQGLSLDRVIIAAILLLRAGWCTRTLRPSCNAMRKRRFTVLQSISLIFSTVWPPRLPDIASATFSYWISCKTAFIVKKKEKKETFVSDHEDNFYCRAFDILTDSLPTDVKNIIIRLERIPKSECGKCEQF